MLPAVSAAPAVRPVPAGSLLSVYAGPTVVWHPLKDMSGKTVSAGLAGASAGVQVCITDEICIAAEGQRLFAGSIPQVESFYQDGLFGAVRWNMAPEVTPCLWLEAGTGITKTAFRQEKREEQAWHHVSPALWLGGNGSFSLGKNWFAGYALRLMYQPEKDVKFIIRYASRWSLQGTLSFSKHF